mmetsp:Transcript_27556/g.74983  ORF Transcript_27556/g.74983 Transcript_27556/m.74983 type:complete len:313 (-) Transcript_27556:205-1143(-)
MKATVAVVERLLKLCDLSSECVDVVRSRCKLLADGHCGRLSGRRVLAGDELACFGDLHAEHVTLDVHRALLHQLVLARPRHDCTARHGILLCVRERRDLFARNQTSAVAQHHVHERARAVAYAAHDLVGLPHVLGDALDVLVVREVPHGAEAAREEDSVVHAHVSDRCERRGVVHTRHGLGAVVELHAAFVLLGSLDRALVNRCGPALRRGERDAEARGDELVVRVGDLRQVPASLLTGLAELVVGGYDDKDMHLFAFGPLAPRLAALLALAIVLDVSILILSIGVTAARALTVVQGEGRATLQASRRIKIL